MPALHTTITLTKLKQLGDGTLRNAKGERVDSLSDIGVVGFVARRGARDIHFRLWYGPQHARRYQSLGRFGDLTLDQARHQAAALRALIAAGGVPRAATTAPARPSSESLTAVVKTWLAQHEGKPKTVSDYWAAVNNHVLPHYGPRSIYSLSRDDMTVLIDGIAAKHMAHFVKRTLNACFTWKQARDSKFTNPIVRGQFKRPNRKRKGRFLSDRELRELWRAIALTEAHGQPFGWVRMALLTGMRSGAVTRMHRSQIEGDANDLWRFPIKDPKNSEREHICPLSPPALALIGNRNGFIFSSDGGKTPVAWPTKTAALDRAITELRGGEKMPHWTFHDLRRTARTLMAREKVPYDIAERAIAHKVGQMDDIYNLWDHLDEKRDAMNKLASRIMAIVEPPPSDKAVSTRGTIMAQPCSLRAIRTEADYEAALARVDELMDAEAGTSAGEELDALVDLIERYEAPSP